MDLTLSPQMEDNSEFKLGACDQDLQENSFACGIPDCLVLGIIAYQEKYMSEDILRYVLKCKVMHILLQ